MSTSFEDSQSPVHDLLARARQGDSDAVGSLLSLYRNYLVFLARSQMHRHLMVKTDPSDMAQEACLQAHQHMEQFRGETIAEFTAWLRGILTNILAMNVRRYHGTQKRDPRLEQTLAAGVASASGFLQSAIAGDITSPSQQLAKQESFLKLAAALESLPEDYRQVIVLRNIEAMSFKDVAQTMGRSVDSVEKLWVRGLSKLKKIMSDDDCQ